MPLPDPAAFAQVLSVAAHCMEPPFATCLPEVPCDDVELLYDGLNPYPLTTEVGWRIMGCLVNRYKASKGDLILVALESIGHLSATVAQLRAVAAHFQIAAGGKKAVVYQRLFQNAIALQKTQGAQRVG